MPKIVTLLTACAVVALAAGCGGGGGSTSSSSAPASTSGGGSTAGGGVQVKMKNIQFSPSSVTVKVGQKVTWVNDDTVTHNVTSQDGQIKSSNFGQGQSFSFTPTKAGTIKYTCTIHPGMNGTLVVQ